jgi:hypothetical protein
MFTLLFALFVAGIPKSGEILVHVVDGESRPVAGAWVACGADHFGSSHVELKSLREWIQRGGEGLPQADLRWARTSADGTARVREIGFWNDVLAVTPTGGAHIYVPRGTAKEVTLTLLSHRFWRVQVVDPADAKARPRLPVTFGRESGGRRDDVAKFETVEESGNDGVTTFGPIDLAIDPDEIDPILTATLEMPCLVRPMVRTRVGQLPVSPTVLELPPHGSYEIRLSEKDGRPSERRVVVDVSTDESRQLHLPGPHAAGWRAKFVNENGIVRVDPVGVGVEMRIEPESALGTRDSENSTKRRDDAGPVEALRQPGEVRVVRLQAPPSGRERLSVAMRGRVVDPNGAPLSFHGIELEIFDASKKAILADTSTPAASDDAGAFEAKLDVEAPSHAATLVVLDRGARGSEIEEIFAAGTKEIGDVAKWQAGDLGEVRLDPIPLLFSGRIVNQNGDPLPGLVVAIECDGDSFQTDATIPSWWRARFDRRGHRCDGDGRFEIHGFAGKQRFDLLSWQDSGPYSVLPKRTMVAGTRDVVIRRAPGDANPGEPAHGAVVGELLLDPDVPRNVVTVDLEDPGWSGDAEEQKAPEPTSRAHFISLDDALVSEPLPGDRFAYDHAPVGRWNVRVAFQMLGQPLHELWRRDDVEIKPHETLLLPPVDLRGRIKVARIELVDSEGRPVPSGHVFCRERAQRPRKPTERSLAELPDYGMFKNGRYVACAIDDWSTLEFLGQDCRRISRRFESPGTWRVVLPPRIEVRLKLPPELRLPRRPLALDASLHTEKILTGVLFVHGGEPPDGDSAMFDETGSAALRLPAAAEYKLTVRVRHADRRSGGSSFDTSEVVTMNSIVIADSDEPQVIELPVTQREVDHAVEKLGY